MSLNLHVYSELNFRDLDIIHVNSPLKTHLRILLTEDDQQVLFLRIFFIVLVPVYCNEIEPFWCFVLFCFKSVKYVFFFYIKSLHLQELSRFILGSSKKKNSCFEKESQSQLYMKWNNILQIILALQCSF